MKRLQTFLMCLFVVMTISLSAQEVTITLNPGTTWIGYYQAEPMNIATALGNFVPMNGDKIKSLNNGTATYMNGQWRGSLSQFTPGLGYMYTSMRSEPVTLTFGGNSSITVTTSEPTNITLSGFTCSGTVTDAGNSAIVVHGLCWGTEPNPTVAGSHTSGDFGMGSFSSVIENLEENTTYYVRAYALTEKGMVYGNEKSFSTLPIPTYTITVSANPTEGGTVSGGGTYEQAQSCTVTAIPNTGYIFVNWTENGNEVSINATCSFTVDRNRNLVANFEVPTIGGQGFVDLGLPSGLLWATCNVGANSPEDYGDYFAWGETQPKEVYNWSTYQYCNGSFQTLTKYCNNSSYGYNGFTDDLTTLQLEDDAAMANWGSEWRIPAKGEWQELYDNTTCTWTTQNGVNGQLFTASNGNSLFLPAAGSRISSGLVSTGSSGQYLSRTLYTNGPWGAWRVFFDSDDYFMGSSERYYGHSVRAVHPGQNVQSYTISVSANPSDGGSASGGGIYWQGLSCMVMATANGGYVFTNWTENGEVVSTDASYTFTVYDNRTLVANFSEDYVDLGLPSGILWANCNVGADTPEDYGDYFAWGEIQPKDYYDWSTYQYCNGSITTLTKYCNNSPYGYNGFTDNLTALLPEDDAARANWGGAWRMPTKEEWEELYNNTTCTWTTQNGVNGQLFTASNGNSLFLPATGDCILTNLNGAGIRGDYWSSALYTDSPYSAWEFEFNSDEYDMVYYLRAQGCTVRAVHSGQNSSQTTAPTGAINGKFSINSSGDQVYFSQGNLQYQASTNTWKFAEHQYDYVGSDNSNISSTYSGWIDLFGWGTSGYDHGANCYQPWSTTATYSDYYAYGNYYWDLNSSTGQADWGYNPISNGGNQQNQWRTLSYGQWYYVINNRNTASGIRYAKAKVNNINGVILLPDDWNSSYFYLGNTNNSGATFSSNTINASQWNTLEQHGAVFLPAAGYRLGVSSISSVGSSGCYWSSSYYSTNNAYAYYMNFADTDLSTGRATRYRGQSVRLVHSVQ